MCLQMLDVHAELLASPDTISSLLYPVDALQDCPECTQSAGSPPFWILVDFGHLKAQVDSWRKGEDEVGFFFLNYLVLLLRAFLGYTRPEVTFFFFSGAGDFSLDNFLWVPITNLFSCPFRSTFDNSSNCS